MFLKRLELLGFKSFATRTTAEFSSGISVVVGPNGSGKSNIADAVRWVLGEQSAKAVRARKPEEVIFAGSAARQPLGMAEVALVLDNADGTLPVEYGEVRVSRRLYRSGESEYLLNGARVRLRDITQHLLHASLGPDTYSVIGQGAVDELILQRPDERRVAFENAADIRRHQLKLADTRSRMATTEANLVRVQDVIAELAPHVRRLKSQVERAGRAERVRDELDELLLRTFRMRLTAAHRVRDAAERELVLARQQVERTEAETRAAEERLAADERLLATLEAEQAAVRSGAEAHRDQARAAEHGLALTRERLTATTDQHVSVGRELERLSDQIAGVSTDDGWDDDTPAAEAAEFASLRQRLEGELAPAHEAAQHARAEALLKRERTEDRINQAELRLAHFENEARQAEAAEAVHAAREADRRARISALEGRLPQLVDERARLQERLDAARSALAAAGTMRRATSQRVDQAREVLRAANQQADRLHGALAALGAPDRTLHTTTGLPDAWRTALDGIEVLGLAGELAARARPIERLLRGYLLRTLVVRDAAAAREAHRRLSEVLGPDAPAWAILSLDGLLLGAPGEHPVEPASAQAGSTLADWRRQIEAHQAELTVAQQRCQAAEAELSTARQAMEIAERDERAARARIAELEGQLQHARQAERSAQAELSQLRNERAGAGQPGAGQGGQHRAAQVSSEAPQAGGPASAADRAQAARHELAAARAEREQIVERLRQAETEARRLDEQVALVRARLNELELAEAQRRARTSLRTRVLADLEAARRTAEQRLVLLAGQAAELRQREAALVEEARTSLLELTPLQEQLATAERARLEVVERRRGLEQRLGGLRAAERAARAAWEERLLISQRAVTELELLDQEISAAAELSEHQPAWVVQLKLETAPEDDIDLEVARRRIAVLQRELRVLGAVAAGVVEEYRDLSERHDFLLTQAGDLRTAMAELQQAAEELERSMRERFAEVFAATQRSFEQCFKRLFGGGEAQLILTEPADPLRGGIDILARPPGKKLQNLLTLSGGERALTVVALLFGLLEVNPTPFCVLDEVDAALDESNVQRFADVLADFSRRIQFIVVTHNRATMEKADGLYGVSMDAQGASRLFSVQPRELARA